VESADVCGRSQVELGGAVEGVNRPREEWRGDPTMGEPAGGLSPAAKAQGPKQSSTMPSCSMIQEPAVIHHLSHSFARMVNTSYVSPQSPKLGLG
jgi:hypothetical protein